MTSKKLKRAVGRFGGWVESNGDQLIAYFPTVQARKQFEADAIK